MTRFDKLAAAHPIFVATAASVAALAVAYISQYGFGLAPCDLCFSQRYPYMAIIALGAVAGVMRRVAAPLLEKAHSTFLLLMTGLALTDLGYAIFHAGVEKDLWDGPSHCTATIGGGSHEELLEQIMNAPLVRCDVPAFEVFGLTFAGMNAIYATVLTLFLVRAIVLKSRA